jgi:CMP-N-acetylneuraminic acid synthetase
MRVLATIHARENSSRFPGKNLASFRGEPIIVHWLRTALNSEYITDIAFSTDSEVMKSIARTLSCRIMVLDRPEELAHGNTVLARKQIVPHTVHQWREMAGHYDRIGVAGVQSLHIADDIVDRCVDILTKAGRGTVESVVRVRHSHPMFMYRRQGEFIKHYMGVESENIPNTQDFEPLWHLQSSCYCRFDPPIPGPIHPVYLEPWEIVDIDEKIDLYVADAMRRFKDEQVMAKPAVESG